jgi:aspartate-semialdehyde dehydrogenase
MGTDLRVAVAGATGALGGEIVKVLESVSWSPATLVALARASTSTSHVEYRGGRVPVDDLTDDNLEGVDGLILAVPAAAAGPVVETAIRRGVPTIDCSASQPDDLGIPLVVPWVNPEALAEASRGVLAVPDPAATLVASILGPLRRGGLDGAAEATVLVPASIEGKAGIEELSRQVVALFNSGAPPRKVFPNGLAFDLLPSVGALEDDGWTRREKLVAAEVRRVASVSGPLDVALVGVPVFSGMSAEIVLHPGRQVLPDLVLRILTDGGVQGPESAGVRYLPRPRRVEGRPFAHVGRIRVGADGQTLHVWASMDNLRTTATAAVAAAGALLGVAGGPVSE